MVKKMRDAYHDRRRVMSDALAETSMKVAGSASFGGSSFWVETPEGTDTRQLSNDLLSKGVLIEPGNPFFPREERQSNFCRLAYSSITPKLIPEGVRRIEETLQTQYK